MHIQMPILSVIIPVYNVEEYVQECLNHVIAQTLRDIEIIVVNDGSTDNSLKIVKEFQKKDNRIKVINKRNGGLSSARNAGLNIARGQYIAFIDSDDYPELDMYEKLIKLTAKYNVRVAICSYYRSIKEKEIQNNHITERLISKEDAMYEMACCKHFASHAWSKIYEKSLFDGIRYPQGRVYEDVFTTYKLIARVDYVAYTSECLYFYRYNNNSISHRKYVKNDIDLVYGSVEYFNFLRNHNYSIAAQCQKHAVTRNSIAILRKMFFAKVYDINQVNYLVMRIKEGYPKYLFSQYKTASKIFGIIAILSVKFLYKMCEVLIACSQKYKNGCSKCFVS